MTKMDKKMFIRLTVLIENEDELQLKNMTDKELNKIANKYGIEII